MKPIITLEALCFGYDARPVLEGFTLDFPAGKVTAILGPNGAGKSTLLHLMVGLLTPRSGQIWLDGRPRQAYGRREMGRLVGLVPQDEYIPFDFTVLEYVLLGRAPYLELLETPREADRQVACRALETVGAVHLRARPVTTLSGGERQLVTVARALAQEPRILLLDEPTSHLDLGNQKRVLQLMRTLAAQGTTVIFTTHDPGAAALVADYVVLMRDGQVLAAGENGTALTAERLTATYGVPITVIEVDGRHVVVLEA